MLDMRGNTVYVVVLILNTISDQFLNIAIEMFYDTLGPQGAFQVWWGWHFFIFFNLHIVAPIMIIYNAYKNFPEFRGFEPKVFPGKEAPRCIEVIPHRPEMKKLEEFKEEKKKSVKSKQRTAKKAVKIVYMMMPPIPGVNDSLPVVVIH